VVLVLQRAVEAAATATAGPAGGGQHLLHAAMAELPEPGPA
jgi:hypothetical protein